MTKPEAVKAAALERVGCPYVFGGTGKTCTPQYREARMAQYPDYANKIRNNCPRLRGSASSCSNCKWADENGKGRPCYDCAQLALAAMKAADIPLVSGSDSQWRKTVYSERGVIADMPHDKVCLVFRNDSDSGIKMGHVGTYLGDETVVHARGHEFGVVHQELSATAFTHYLIPSGLYDDGLPTLRRGNSGSYVERMQNALVEAGAQLDVDGKFGRATEDAVKNFQSAHGLKADGICGPKTWEKLKTYFPEGDVPDWVEDDPIQVPDVHVDREDLTDLLNHVEAMAAHLEVMIKQLEEDSRALRDWMAK